MYNSNSEVTQSQGKKEHFLFHTHILAHNRYICTYVNSHKYVYSISFKKGTKTGN